MTKPIAAPMVRVVWLDAAMSCTKGQHWHDGEPETPGTEPVLSVGYLTHLTRGWIKLVQSLTEGQHGNFIEIPRGMVLTIESLEPNGGKIKGWNERNHAKRLREAGL